MLLPRAAWGQGEVEPTIVGIPPRSASHCLLPGQDSKPQEAELGRAEELDLWDWGLGQGSRLCPPGEQGLRGGTEHSPVLQPHNPHFLLSQDGPGRMHLPEF